MRRLLLIIVMGTLPVNIFAQRIFIQAEIDARISFLSIDKPFISLPGNDKMFLVKDKRQLSGISAGYGITAGADWGSRRLGVGLSVIPESIEYYQVYYPTGNNSGTGEHISNASQLSLGLPLIFSQDVFSHRLFLDAGTGVQLPLNTTAAYRHVVSGKPQWVLIAGAGFRLGPVVKLNFRYQRVINHLNNNASIDYFCLKVILIRNFSKIRSSRLEIE